MSDDHDFDFEPLPGVPAALPEGERVLWRGAPEPWRFAARCLRLSWIGAYFSLLAGWQVASGISEGAPLTDILSILSWTATLCAVTCGVLAVAGWVIAKNSIYTITSHRVIFRHGVAMPMAINVPFAKIDGAHHRPFADGTGDVALVLAPDSGIYRLLLWPHVRPGRYMTTEPMLRTLKDGERVASILAEALAASTRTAASSTRTPNQAQARVSPASVAITAPGAGQANSVRNETVMT